MAINHFVMWCIKINNYYFEENIFLLLMEDLNESTIIIEWELWPLVLENDHNGVRWKNSHHLCYDWSEAYINSVMSDPAQNIPWKWSIWKCPMISNY